MHFFVHEIVARLLAAYLCFDSIRKLRRGLIDRRVTSFSSSWFDWSQWVDDRDTTPVCYWIQIGLLAVGGAACLFAAIFGWWLLQT